MNALSDEHLFLVIQQGGAAVGESPLRSRVGEVPWRSFRSETWLPSSARLQIRPISLRTEENTACLPSLCFGFGKCERDDPVRLAGELDPEVDRLADREPLEQR